MQDTWLSAKADEIQCYADRHDTKWFYDALKAFPRPSTCWNYPVHWKETDPGEINWTLWQCPQPPLYNQLHNHWTPFTGSGEPGTRLSPDDWKSGESPQANVHQGNLRIGHNLCWVVQGWWLCPASPDHPPLLVLMGQRATPSKVLELQNDHATVMFVYALLSFCR